MILAQLTSEMVKKAAEDTQRKAKAEEKGFFGGWAAQMGAGINYAQRHMGMEPESILRENAGNFAVDNSNVYTIRIRQEDEDSKEYEFEIETGACKHSHIIDGYPESTDALKQIIGERVKASGKGFTIRL